MVIPLAMLAIMAFVVIRSLMGVVAREAGATPPAVDAPAPAGGLTDPDVRAFLSPAAGAHVGEDAPVEMVDITDADASRA